MAWTAPTDRLTGDVITAAQWNTFLGTTGDMSMTAAAKVTTNGDTVYATGANTLARLGIGTAGQTLQVSGGIPAWVTVAAAEPFFDSERTAFRANRRRVAEWVASNGVAQSGFGYSSSIGAITNITGEPVNTNTGVALYLLYCASGVLSPSHSPRMLFRTQLPAASANVTYFQMGFFDNYGATATGAYIRIVTTGNTFFVTRQGASETATDLGVLSRTTVLGFEIESTDAGVTWVCRNQAGSALATHTTNVPTAATAINYGFASLIATAAVNHSIGYISVEGTFA